MHVLHYVYAITKLHVLPSKQPRNTVPVPFVGCNLTLLYFLGLFLVLLAISLDEVIFIHKKKMKKYLFLYGHPYYSYFNT